MPGVSWLMKSEPKLERERVFRVDLCFDAQENHINCTNKSFRFENYILSLNAFFLETGVNTKLSFNLYSTSFDCDLLGCYLVLLWRSSSPRCRWFGFFDCRRHAHSTSCFRHAVFSTPATTESAVGGRGGWRFVTTKFVEHGTEQDYSVV